MSKKKSVILFLLFLAIICLVNPTFANKSETVVQKINIIANNTQSYNNIFGVENPEEIITIRFEDEVLYSSIKSQFKTKINSYDDLTYEIKITNANLSTITSINLPGSDDETKKISNLSGIENFKYLTKLSLSNNKITNIDVIKELTQLVSLDLSENPDLDDITDFLETSNLVNLQELNITNTRNKRFKWNSKIK
mgnify:CR=1 FL=1